MKPKLYTTTLIIFSILLFSCKNASKLYRQGRYDEAVGLATKKLSKKPNDRDMIDLVQNAYRYAVEDHERRISTLTNTNSDLRYEEIFNEYQSLQYLFESIRRSPSVYDLVKPTDYSRRLTAFQEEASNARVERGLELMSQNNKLGYRDAFVEFQRALALKPGDIGIRQKMDDAFANAVTNVVVMPLTRAGFQFSNYDYDMSSFNNNLLRYLTNNSRNQFLQYFPGNQAQIRPEYIVDLRFSDVNIGVYRDTKETREVLKQVVSKEIVINKDSTVKQYTTVKAKITVITRSLKADGLLQAAAHDESNRLLWSDTYRGDYQWIESFASYTGDERALGPEDKKLLNEKEPFPPSNNEIIKIIMNEIQLKTQCGISEFFARSVN